jgi:hypothetical protein
LIIYGEVNKNIYWQETGKVPNFLNFPLRFKIFAPTGNLTILFGKASFYAWKNYPESYSVLYLKKENRRN